jgi:hypothetical protein
VLQVARPSSTIFREFQIMTAFCWLAPTGWVLLLVLASVTPGLSQTFGGVLTEHNDNARTGQNLTETVLTPLNVKSGGFGKLFSYSVDGQIYAQPLYVSNVEIPGQGQHNVIYVATQNDSVYAFDADGRRSTPFWQDSFISPSQGITPVPCQINGKNVMSCAVYPIYGITGTPVIDPSTNTMYLIARTLENGEYFQRLHALDVTNGAERFGGPVVIGGSVLGIGAGHGLGPVRFSTQHDIQRAGLLLLNGTIYAGWAGALHGWIMAYDASTLAQVGIFTSTPNAIRGGVWQSGSGLAADDLGNIYVATGDALFDASTGGTDYGDSLLKLSAGLSVLDYFAPMDQACRFADDLDLGSAGPILLPVQPGSVPNELVIAGKGGNPCDVGGATPIYLLNRDNLGKYNPQQDQIVETVAGAAQGYWSNPTYWQGPSAANLYMGGVTATARRGKGDYLKMYSVSNGLLSTSPVAQSANIFPMGSTPSISANGAFNGIVWAIERQEGLNVEAGQEPAILYAYDATNISTMLYNSAQAAARDQGGCAEKFQVPTIANGKVYVSTQNELDVFGLLNGPVEAAPNVFLSSPCHAFPVQGVNTTSPAFSLLLTNSGNTSLAITSIAITGTNAGDFAQTNNCPSSLPSDGSCTVTVTFTPTAVGARTGYVMFLDNAVGSPHNVYLIGKGQ